MHFDPISDFCDVQWDILALLQILDGPVPMDMLAVLVPVEPGPFYDLINCAIEHGWLDKDGDHCLRLKASLPAELSQKLAERFPVDRALELLQVITEKFGREQFEPVLIANLLEHAGRRYDAACLVNESAFTALMNREIEPARALFSRVARNLHVADGTAVEETLYVSAVLKLSRLTMLLGSELDEPPALLSAARTIADDLGDRRSLALIDLHTGVYEYLADKIPAALEDLSRGMDIVESLGDEDIHQQTAEYRGIYYYIQGLYREAVDCFEQAMQVAVSSELIMFNFAVPIFLGQSAALIGQFHRAIGVLDSSWRRASIQGKYRYATLYQVSLGLVLMRMGKHQDALAHLLQARDDAIEQDNNRALYFAQLGILLYHHLEGHVDKVVEVARNSIPTNLGKVYTWPYGQQYTWPVFLEINDKYDALGYTPVPEHLPKEDMEKLIHGPNLNLKGAMLRIVALRKKCSGANTEEVESMLEASQADLLRSGDPIELAKTRIEIARLKLQQHQEAAARDLALKVWEDLGALSEHYFPDDLKYLLSIQTDPVVALQPENTLGRFMEMMDEFVPSTDQDELLNRLIAGTCRFFGAERGGLFWWNGKRGLNNTSLRAGYNLTLREADRDEFRFSRGLITKALHNGQPLVFTAGQTPPRHQVKASAVLCLPLEIRGTVQGVLYHENSYIEKDYRLFDRSLLLQIMRHVSSYIERIEGYCRLIEEQTTLAKQECKSTGNRYGDEIVSASSVMRDLLEQVDAVARSDAPILILGETGVGKELLARRIHAQSGRAEGPFVAVELASIPENLIESELFGHEKGAFTGADRQKPGRLELAHRGTLFIDEVGDIPASVQVKLLRMLQEKNFVRIGGTRTLSSDFRLVSATNRDLAREVAGGKFREDLYYRLNVVPFQIPPLRQRGDDVVRLARHFLVLYARKYNKHNLRLSAQDDARINAYHWPGNVRELQNIIERSVILSRDGAFDLKLPQGPEENILPDITAVTTMDDMQRRHIKAVLELTNGRIDGPDGAAQLLGIKRTTLYARMKKLGITCDQARTRK